MSNKNRSELWKAATLSEAVLETETSINGAPQKCSENGRERHYYKV